MKMIEIIASLVLSTLCMCAEASIDMQPVRDAFSSKQLNSEAMLCIQPIYGIIENAMLKEEISEREECVKIIADGFCCIAECLSLNNGDDVHKKYCRLKDRELLFLNLFGGMRELGYDKQLQLKLAKRIGGVKESGKVKGLALEEVLHFNDAVRMFRRHFIYALGSWQKCIKNNSAEKDFEKFLDEFIAAAGLDKGEEKSLRNWLGR